MPRKAKKTVGPPNRIWVVVDALSGNPTLVLKNPPDMKTDLMDDEAVYEFELRKEYGK